VAVETGKGITSGSGVETVRMRFHHLHAAEAETLEKVCSFGSRRCSRSVEEEALRLRPRAKRSVQLVAEVNWRNSERRSGCVEEGHAWHVQRRGWPWRQGRDGFDYGWRTDGEFFSAECNNIGCMFSTGLP